MKYKTLTEILNIADPKLDNSELCFGVIDNHNITEDNIIPLITESKYQEIYGLCWSNDTKFNNRKLKGTKFDSVVCQNIISTDLTFTSAAKEIYQSTGTSLHKIVNGKVIESTSMYPISTSFSFSGNTSCIFAANSESGFYYVTVPQQILSKVNSYGERVDENLIVMNLVLTSQGYTSSIITKENLLINEASTIYNYGPIVS